MCVTLLVKLLLLFLLGLYFSGVNELNSPMLSLSLSLLALWEKGQGGRECPFSGRARGREGKTPSLSGSERFSDRREYARNFSVLFFLRVYAAGYHLIINIFGSSFCFESIRRAGSFVGNLMLACGKNLAGLRLGNAS